MVLKTKMKTLKEKGMRKEDRMLIVKGLYCDVAGLCIVALHVCNCMYIELLCVVGGCCNIRNEQFTFVFLAGLRTNEIENASVDE